MRISVFLSFILLTCIACTNLQETKQIDTAKSAPGLHAIFSEELQQIMQRMNVLVYERELTALQLDELKKENFTALMNTATDLVIAAEHLREALPGIKLSAEEQATFRALANQLYHEAETLHIVALNNDYENLATAYERLNSTCAACHQLYRF